jgi:hypothetical protein
MFDITSTKSVRIVWFGVTFLQSESIMKCRRRTLIDDRESSELLEREQTVTNGPDAQSNYTLTIYSYLRTAS